MSHSKIADTVLGGFHYCRFCSPFCSTLPLPESEGRPESEPDQPEEEEGGGEDLAEEDHLAYADDLRDENYHPSLDR